MDTNLLICFTLLLILFLLYNNGNGFSVGGTSPFCTEPTRYFEEQGCFKMANPCNCIEKHSDEFINYCKGESSDDGVNAERALPIIKKNNMCPSSSCTDKLTKLCWKAKFTSERDCDVCVADHQSPLRDASCTADDVGEWCSGADKGKDHVKAEKFCVDEWESCLCEQAYVAVSDGAGGWVPNQTWKTCEDNADTKIIPGVKNASGTDFTCKDLHWRQQGPKMIPPVCRWNGAAPLCDGECTKNQTEIERNKSGKSGNICVSGKKVLCRDN